MKKGLSILLVAAALFGFYGSAVSVNDILACKDYWEEAGAKSTADMNKLEDGLNQLKDNEQAYLDGKKQVVDGEKALKDAEIQLADGEAQLAAGRIQLEEGRAELAQGEADYAAAPKKLADGKAQLDENKDSYTAGSSFKKVIDAASRGLSNDGAFNIIKNLLASAGVSGVPESYNRMATTLGQLNALKKGTDGITNMNSEQAFKTAVASQSKSIQKQLASGGVDSYKHLKEKIVEAGDGISSIEELKGKVDLFTGKKEAQLREILVKNADALKKAGITSYSGKDGLAAKEKALREGKATIDKLAALPAAQLKEALVRQNAKLAESGIESYSGDDGLAAKSAALTAGKEQIDDVAGLSDSDLQDTLVGQSEDLKKAGINDYATLAAKEEALRTGKEKIDGLVAMSEDQRKDAFAKENGFADYADITDKLGALQQGKEMIDNLAGKSDAELGDILVQQNSDLANVGITTYAALEASVEQLSNLANLKDKIDGNADLDTVEKKDAAVKAQGIEGIDTYAALEAKVSMLASLKVGKEKVDGIIAMGESDRKDAFAKEKGFSGYAEITGNIEALSDGKGMIDNLAGLDADTLKKTLIQQNKDLADAGITTYAALSNTSKNLSDGKAQIDGFVSDRDSLKDYIVSNNADLKNAGITNYKTLEANEEALREGKATIDAIAAMSETDRKDAFVQQNDELKAAKITTYKKLAENSAALTTGKKTVDDSAAYLDGASSNKALGFVWQQLSKQQQTALKAQGIDGTSYKALERAINSLKETRSSLKELKKGTDGITGMTSNKALQTAIGTQDKATKQQLKDAGITSYAALISAISSLNQLNGFTGILTSQRGNSPQTTYVNIVNTLRNAGYGSMVSALPSTYNELAAKLQQYEDGVRTYLKGLADYKAAPAKLAAGRQQLAEGEAKLAEGEATLADGYKQYEDGKKKLAEGKDQLAQYEDGEQQIRDGLATLVGTKADLDLESIYDRLGGDGDFDNGDKHLEIDEGLAAVEVGRGYQAEDGVLITNEIMGRAVGTGGLLAAGVLAVIAAILSFIKKNKGAGVFAILAAAAGAFGAFYGTQAGTYFSSIAGSTVGATGWIAAGILGAVALVHAIAHFTAGKAA